jgi:orotate phosphoribosyltransferase
MSSAQKVAEALLRIGAFQFDLERPYQWSSGWQAPVYCDNRLALSYPEVRGLLVEQLQALQAAQFPAAQAIAGVATAGIPHATLLADRANLPLLYVRSKAKAHGLGNQVEGHLQPGQPVLVVEDLISTGNSSLQAVEALREGGAEVIGLLSIFSYGFPQAGARFHEHAVPHESLCTFETLIQQAEDLGRLSPETLGRLRAWQADPAHWSLV